MKKIITGLTLLACLGLAGISSQAYAGERHKHYDNHSYSNDSDERHAYRKGYRDAKRDYRQYRRHQRAKWKRRHARSHRQNRWHEHRHNDRYRSYDRHRRVNHHNDYDWRVVFKF